MFTGARQLFSMFRTGASLRPWLHPRIAAQAVRGQGFRDYDLNAVVPAIITGMQILSANCYSDNGCTSSSNSLSLEEQNVTRREVVKTESVILSVVSHLITRRGPISSKHVVQTS